MAQGVVSFLFAVYGKLRLPIRCERRSPLHHQSRLFTYAPPGASFIEKYLGCHERQSIGDAHSRATPRDPTLRVFGMLGVNRPELKSQEPEFRRSNSDF